MSLKDRLRAFLQELHPHHALDFSENTELIRSGFLDSLALFQLAIWIEKETASPIDPTAFDLAREWETISSIVSFVERNRANEPLKK